MNQSPKTVLRLPAQALNIVDTILYPWHAVTRPAQVNNLSRRLRSG